MLLIEALTFLLSHLSVLFIFLSLAYLFGASAATFSGSPAGNGHKLFINTGVGLGITIIVLFLLATLKLLTVPHVSLSLLFLAVFSMLYLKKKRLLLSSFNFYFSWRKSTLAIVGFSIILLLPLYPPILWDELSYHLPYAQFYAENNGLAVNPYLRYPLYSHNFNLLYSMSLLFQDDILAHLFHTAAGGLIAIGIVSFSRRFTNSNIGIIAAFLFLLAPIVRLFMGAAYIDLGLSLFVFLAFYSLMLFDQEKRKYWLVVCAGSLGVAGGTKYLGLTYIPVFMVFIWVIDKQFKSLALFFGVALLVACPWYVRSAIISGNPFSPFAGDFFGYWIWDASDLSAQKQELFQYHGLKRSILSFFQLPINMLMHPEKFKAFTTSAIWLFPLWFCTLFFNKFGRVNRFIIVFTTFNLLLWFMGAQIMRYLLPILPFLTMLTAILIFNGWSVVCAKVRIVRYVSDLLTPPITKTFFFLILILCGVGLELRLKKYPLPISVEKREQYLTEKLDFYNLFAYTLKNTTGKIYQFGFENSFYYGGPRVMGDWYGLARYGPLVDSAKKPKAVHQYLSDLNADIFIVNTLRAPFARIDVKALVACGFKLLYEDTKGVVLNVPSACEKSNG